MNCGAEAAGTRRAQQQLVSTAALGGRPMGTPGRGHPRQGRSARVSPPAGTEREDTPRALTVGTPAAAAGQGKGGRG